MLLSFEFGSDRLLTGYYLDDQGSRIEVIRGRARRQPIRQRHPGQGHRLLSGPWIIRAATGFLWGSPSPPGIDGDETRADLQIAIDDGIDPGLGLDAGGSLQEGGASQIMDGQLPVNVGSDRLVSLNFEVNQPGLNGLTSGGQPTHYEVNGNRITLLDAGGKTILTVTLGLDGRSTRWRSMAYWINRSAPTASTWGCKYRAPTLTGTKATSAPSIFISPTAPLPQVDTVSLTLVEDSDWSAAQILSGDLNITAGSDPLVNIAFDASQPGLRGLTSGGAPVVISVSGNSISGTVNGQNVFTLTLSFDKAGQAGHYDLYPEPAAGSGQCRSVCSGGLHPHRFRWR